MAGKYSLFVIFFLLALAALTACEETASVAGPSGGEGSPSTTLAGLGECQNTTLADAADTQQLTVSVADGKVYFTHERAIFNCCVDSVTLSLATDGADIVLTEREYCSNPCHCVCPRDVTGEIEGLAAGTYSLAVCDTSGTVLCTSEVFLE